MLKHLFIFVLIFCVYMALAMCIWGVLSRRFLIQKIFSLILVFVYLSYALLLSGLELLSLVILLLYVGAIAVLFLFVIMILNPDYHLLLEEEKEMLEAEEEKIKPSIELERPYNIIYDAVVTILVGFVLPFIVFVYVFIRPVFYRKALTQEFLPDGTPAPYVYYVAQKKTVWLIHKPHMNLVELGTLLYTTYGIGVFIIGGCLLVAMIGSILLCVNRTLKLKRQNISKQSKRYK